MSQVPIPEEGEEVEFDEVETIDEQQEILDEQQVQTGEDATQDDEAQQVDDYVDDQNQYSQFQDFQYDFDPDGYASSTNDWDNTNFGDQWGLDNIRSQYLRGSGSTYDDYSYSDDPNYYEFDGEDQEFEDEDFAEDGMEDTMRDSSEEDEDEETEDEEEEEFSFRSRAPKKKKSGPVEVSKPTLRWYSRKLLQDHIPSSDEDVRRKALLEKCQIVRRVSKPVETIFGGKAKKSSGASKAGDEKVEEKESRQSVFGEEETSRTAQTFREYTENEWAVKNTVDFLTTEGCSSSSSGKTYDAALKSVREEADFRLDLYEKQLQRRRMAVGHADQTPEITDAMKRHAERAVWRAVIDNTKPRYPLPRFILPRHRYLKKVQAQFIGPGTYEVDVYEAQTKFRRMKLPSTWATCAARFPKDKSETDKNAAAGSRNLDPWTNLDKANYHKKYPGTYIPFESTPANFRKGLALAGSGIPPNAYEIKSPLEEFIKKTTSLRGPYDCYTPSRAIIPYGYFKTNADEERCRLGPGSYEIRTSLVKEMNDSYHIFKGKMGKAERSAMFGFKAAFEHPLWPKENGIPPVGLYNPDTDTIGRDKVQEKAPFKVQVGWKKKKKTKPELVAADYYYFGSGKWTVPPIGASLASAFKSKTPQIMTPKVHHVRKERNRAINKKFDYEGGGHKLETHYALDPPIQHYYALEDCKDPCVKQGGPRVDPYAIPGHGAINLPGGKVVTGKCCNCG